MPAPRVQMLTAGSAPLGIQMREMESELGIRVLASYGLTEVRLTSIESTYEPTRFCVFTSRVVCFSKIVK